MRKLKKFAAALLSAAMVLTSMTVPVFAAEQDVEKMPTIDTTKTGSLTIHKYEYNESAGEAGTGESTDTVPEGAKPLAGVTFEIKKVAELDDYYGTEAKALPTVEEAKRDTANVKPISKMTGENGTAVFEGLALGLYLVHEASAPAQITGKVPDFLVSIPMTNSTEDDWLYDVHVFPKNSSTYAGVTLLKQGKVGDGDASALAGATFVLQKKDSDNGWSTVIKNNKNVDIGTDGTLTTGGDGKIIVSDLAPGTYRFVETGVPKNTGFIMDGTDTREFEITSEGNVKIYGKLVDTNQNPITVINYKPDVEKEVKDRTNETWGDASDYSAGSTVPYRVKVDVPENVAKLVDFTISDTMEKQTYKADTLKIYSDADLKNEILTGTYKVNTEGTPAWSIAFNSKEDDGTISSLVSDYAGKSIYIYFETTLDDDAVITSAGNPNTIKLEYSNKILPTTEDEENPNQPGEPGKDVITDQATVYTFQIAVEKVDASNENTKLQGVEFDLYKKLADEANEDGALTNPVNGLTGKYKKINKDSLKTDENGAISVNGLENGEYYLVETKTNDGYNLLKAPVEVKIAAEYATTVKTTTVTDVDGITTTTRTVTNEKFDVGGENGVLKTVIKNSKGFILPTTGGMGTVIFTIGGIALALAGVMIIMASKKKTA